MGDSSFRRHGLHTGPFARRAKVPWKECNQMDERLKFIARLLDGEKMAVLCRQFGISRKTGKIEALKKKRGEYAAHLSALEKSGESQVSLTDPDSRAMAAHTKGGVGYNIQIAVDAKG